MLQSTRGPHQHSSPAIARSPVTHPRHIQKESSSYDCIQVSRYHTSVYCTFVTPSDFTPVLFAVLAPAPDLASAAGGAVPLEPSRHASIHSRASSAFFPYTFKALYIDQVRHTLSTLEISERSYVQRTPMITGIKLCQAHRSEKGMSRAPRKRAAAAVRTLSTLKGLRCRQSWGLQCMHAMQADMCTKQHTATSTGRMSAP